MRFLPGMVAQACTLNAWDAEAGGSKVPGQSSYINETFKKKSVKCQFLLLPFMNNTGTTRKY